MTRAAKIQAIHDRAKEIGATVYDNYKSRDGRSTSCYAMKIPGEPGITFFPDLRTKAAVWITLDEINARP